ncbi:MAG: carboxypeptidase-like regulatory domain-containing protein [Armatimonadota bacterium]
MNLIWRLCFCTVMPALLALAGCVGGSSLTDGSIPIGDVDGVAYLVTRGVAADIPVELVKPSGEVAATVRTNPSGAFAFHDVPQGRWRVRARAEERAGNVEFDLVKDDTVLVVLQVVAVDAAVQAVHLTPVTAQHVNIGDQITFTTEGRDAAGNPLLDLAVSWAVQGHIGTFTPAGLFQATRAGSGLIVAQYGDLQAAVQVIVSPQDGPGPGGI